MSATAFAVRHRAPGIFYLMISDHPQACGYETTVESDTWHQVVSVPWNVSFSIHVKLKDLDTPFKIMCATEVGPSI